MKNYLKLFAAVSICLACGFVGSLFTSTSIDSWYQFLNKPAIAPPNWVFAPVWTLLYILMGIALFLVWISDSPIKKKAVILFLIQLILNAAWSFIFFGIHSIGIALADIVILWAFILLTMIFFFRTAAPAGWLLVPYILWVSFAAVLNFEFFRLNP